VEIATEILWLKNNFGGRTYGVPRWIGCITDVAGRALAQYVNYDLFTNQGIPPMMIIVENGSLTDESKQELQDLLDSMRGAANFNRVGLLEAVPEISGLDNDTSVKVTIKNLTDYRNDDQMFGNYLKYSYDVIRQAFRLPALYLGGVGVYSYSTSLTATQVAEQQIFQVERRLFDEVVNRRIVWNEFGCNLYEFKSRGPQTVGSTDIVNAISAFSNAGAMTTNNVIELANKFFDTEMSQFNAPWANYPYGAVMELIKQGVVSIPDLIAAQPAVTIPTEQVVQVPATAGIAPETTELPTAQQGEPPSYS
jgi:capsid portal protein